MGCGEVCSSCLKFQGPAARQSLHSREKIFNDVILIGSCNDARPLAAVVGRCPALGVTVKTWLREFPQVLLLHWHWGSTRNNKNSTVFVNSYSITEELACKTKEYKSFLFLGGRKREREREKEREILSYQLLHSNASMVLQYCASRDQDGYSL